MKNKNILISLISIPLISLSSCNNQFSIKEIKGEIDIHSEHQKLYLQDDNYNNVGQYSAYATKEGYADPLPITLKWSGGKAPYNINISENNDLSNPLSYVSEEKQINFYNAKIGTTYYYQVSSGENKTETSSFVISDIAPRNIYVDGVDNMRDLGGYHLSNGKTFLQGLIYRSGEFNKNNEVSNKLLISEDGLKQIKDLGIKTEIDLRRNYEKDGKIETSGINSSPLGNDVNYIQAPMQYGGENFLDNSDPSIKEMNLNSIKLVFNTLSDINNYPIVFHCVQGKDRTGCLSYLIEGLLGVNEKDIYRDYLFSNFSRSVGSACKADDIDKKYGLTINSYEGDTLSNKIYNYLNNELGLSTDELVAISDNLSQ